MIKSRTVIALATIAGVAIGGSMLLERRDVAQTTSAATDHAALLPELKSRINDIAKIVVTRGGADVTMDRRDGKWAIAERDHYPVDQGKLRALLLGATDLVIIEPKTANKELLPQLGLTDPTQPLGAAGNGPSRLQFFDGQGQLVAGIVLGNERPSKIAGSDRTDYYVRKIDSDQSYLVEGRVVAPKKPQDIIDKELLNIDAKRVSRVAIDFDGGEKLVIARDSRQSDDFRIVEPAGSKAPKSAFESNNIANTYAHLVADDVVTVANVPAAATPRYTAVLDTFDGLRVTLTTSAADHNVYGRIQAAYVEPAPRDDATTATPTENTTDAAAVDNPPHTATPPTGNAAESSATKKIEPDEVKKEAAAINARMNGWAYQLAEYQVDNIGKRAKDLLKSEEP